MKRDGETKATLDVRTKLLVLLALLSLPLLIISLLQLHSYQRNVNEQAATITRMETTAAAGVLESWVEDHPALTNSAAPVTPEDARELYALVARQTMADPDTALAIFDARGRVLSRLSGESSPAPTGFPVNAEQRSWSDGTVRVTAAQRAEPSGWSVAVGVPLPEHTPAGRAILLLTATWALTLFASSLIAVWTVRRFTNPLRRLAATASTFGGGNLQERAAVETSDEVGTLAHSFNLMAESLQSRFDAVKQQSAFLGEVLDSLPLGVVVLDARLIVRKVNTTFAALTGRDDAELTGRGVYEAAAGLAALSDIVEDVRRTRRAFVNYSLPLELASPRAGVTGREGEEGAKYWDVILWPVKEQSEGRGDLILILSEVSKRVRAEKLATAAFASEKARAAELESVIKQMDEGVIIVDARGRYRVNPAAALILGRRAGEFRDGVEALVADMQLRSLDGRVLPADETPIFRASSEGEHSSGEQYKIVRGDGAERVLAVGATPLNGEDGAREGVVAVFRDITEEVLSHNELVSAYDRLREHDRLKSAFVANVSHELRTPLNVIIGLCQLLALDPQLPLAPLQADAVMRMQRNGRSLLELVNDMLDYSRLEAGHAALHVEDVNVADVARGVLGEFEDEARLKNVHLSIEVSPGLGVVRTDRRKLEKVLSNLVSNAVKFTAEGRVRIRAAEEDGTDRWRLEVADTGIGMSDEALKFIFDGFRQVDDRLARAYSGVGLGLAITRKIVELLGGEITVESEQNEGSCFRITWPRAAHPRTGTGSLISRSEELNSQGEAGARPMRIVR
ncbi:MAG: ATP-binding protein [Pyrinomonadaceae bacterium]